MKQVEWTETALKGLASLDKTSARRIKQAVDRFAQTTAGDVKKLQGVDPAEYRLRVGDFRVGFDHMAKPFASSACVIAKMHIAEMQKTLSRLFSIRLHSHQPSPAKLATRL